MSNSNEGLGSNPLRLRLSQYSANINGWQRPPPFHQHLPALVVFHGTIDKIATLS
jgi:hypothetical protein